MLLAVRVRLLPAVTGLGLAVKEPICGPAARKRAKVKPPVLVATVPATTIRPSGSKATPTVPPTLLPDEAMPPAPKDVSRLPSAELKRATRKLFGPLVL